VLESLLDFYPLNIKFVFVEGVGVILPINAVTASPTLKLLKYILFNFNFQFKVIHLF